MNDRHFGHITRSSSGICCALRDVLSQLLCDNDVTQADSAGSVGYCQGKALVNSLVLAKLSLFVPGISICGIMKNKQR